MVMCGMSAAFSGLFGTPITAAIFAMEVVRRGSDVLRRHRPLCRLLFGLGPPARFFASDRNSYLIGNVLSWVPGHGPCA